MNMARPSLFAWGVTFSDDGAGAVVDGKVLLLVVVELVEACGAAGVVLVTEAGETVVEAIVAE